MNRRDYVSLKEMEDLYILHGIIEGLDQTMSRTKDEKWLRALQYCQTRIYKVLEIT